MKTALIILHQSNLPVSGSFCTEYITTPSCANVVAKLIFVLCCDLIESCAVAVYLVSGNVNGKG